MNLDMAKYICAFNNLKFLLNRGVARIVLYTIKQTQNHIYCAKARKQNEKGTNKCPNLYIRKKVCRCATHHHHHHVYYVDLLCEFFFFFYLLFRKVNLCEQFQRFCFVVYMGRRSEGGEGIPASLMGEFIIYLFKWAAVFGNLS